MAAKPKTIHRLLIPLRKTAATKLARGSYHFINHIRVLLFVHLELTLL